VAVTLIQRVKEMKYYKRRIRYKRNQKQRREDYSSNNKQYEDNLLIFSHDGLIKNKINHCGFVESNTKDMSQDLWI
jgi:hypothetical protein